MRRNGNFNIVQEISNWLLAKTRIGVEWGLGLVRQRCPILCCASKLKHKKIDIPMLVRSCVLLTNAYACLNGNKLSLYFSCVPPSLRRGHDNPDKKKPESVVPH